MKKKTRDFMARVIFIIVCLAVCSRLYPETILTKEGNKFKINGQETFLLEVTYFGILALDTSIENRKEALIHDLQEFKNRGFNCIRIYGTMANWDWGYSESDYKNAGNDGHNDYRRSECFNENLINYSPYQFISNIDRSLVQNNPFYNRMTILLSICNDLGIIVDITLLPDIPLDQEQTPDIRYRQIKPSNKDEHKAWVKKFIQDFGNFKNWYFDIWNEWNEGDASLYTYIGDVIHYIHEEQDVKDSGYFRLCTASCSPQKLDQNDLSVLCEKVDFLAVHTRKLEFESRTVLNDIKSNLPANYTIPIHIQEPTRRGWYINQFQEISSPDKFNAECFLDDLNDVFEGEGAGWCFHNAIGLNDLRNNSKILLPKSMYLNLDPSKAYVDPSNAYDCQNVGLLLTGKLKNTGEFEYEPGQLDSVEIDVANRANQNIKLIKINPLLEGSCGQYLDSMDIQWQARIEGEVEIWIDNNTVEGELYHQLLATVSASQGNYSWEIETDVQPGPHLITIRSHSYPLISDSIAVNIISTPTECGLFKITTPVDTDIWLLGSQHTIRWERNSTANEILSLKLVDRNGSSFPIATGIQAQAKSFPWTVPVNFIAGKYRLKVLDSSGQLLDISQEFTIAKDNGGDCHITAIAPQTGECIPLGSNYTLKWKCSTCVFTGRIFLARNGQPVYDLTNNYWLDENRFNWQVKNIDYSCHMLPFGSGYTIQWASNDIPNRILGESGIFSLGEGISTFSIIANAGPGGTISPSCQTFINKNGSVALTITPNPGYAIQDVIVDGNRLNEAVPTYTFEDIQASHCIEAVFAAVPAITVTSPNGGENWLAGSSHNLTWTSQNIDANEMISIELSRNGGSTWEIIPGSYNPGSKTWTVTGPASTNCLVRVSLASNPAIYDVSDAPFTIASAPQNYTVTVDIQTGHGWILPEWTCCYRVYTVTGGSSFSVTLVPEQGYYGWFYDLSGPGGGRFNFPWDGRITIPVVNENRYITVYFTN